MKKTIILLGLYLGTFLSMAFFISLCIKLPDEVSFLCIISRIFAILFTVLNFFFFGVLIYEWVKQLKEEKK